MDVRRISNAMLPNHTPTAISDTMVLRFHIAILNRKKENKGIQLLSLISEVPSQRDDLHAENDEEGSKCPRGIRQCLERSNPHSTGRETVIGTTPLQGSLWPMSIMWSLMIISALNSVLPNAYVTGRPWTVHNNEHADDGK